MAVDLSTQLHQLQKATNELNSLTDRANDIVRRTEVFLNEKCRLGGSTGVNLPFSYLDTDKEDGPDFDTYLVYERYNGEHRIVVTHAVTGDESGNSKPWAECSREVKLQTIDALPRLIEALLEKVKKRVAEVQPKIDFLDSLIPTESGLKQHHPSVKKA